jgi:hypothetical protein
VFGLVVFEGGSEAFRRKLRIWAWRISSGQLFCWIVQTKMYRWSSAARVESPGAGFYAGKRQIPVQSNSISIHNTSRGPSEYLKFARIRYLNLIIVKLPSQLLLVRQSLRPSSELEKRVKNAGNACLCSNLCFHYAEVFNTFTGASWVVFCRGWKCGMPVFIGFGCWGNDFSSVLESKLPVESLYCL